ncbi:MAG: cytidylate kinase family protein [Desulfobacteraceae bacterium]|nr:cytidylate kinase family protein [Desulfobacteraceae bacterium]
MAIITISRGSYSKGKEIAEKVAQRLGYKCVAREVVIDSAREFNIPEVKLVRAIHDAPSILDQFTYGKEKFIAYFQTALLKSLQRDNIVYHGLAGHFFLKGISHVLKIRIISDMADRVRLEMARENISRQEAESVLTKDDAERRKWSLSLYGIDTADPSLYDLVIHIRKLGVDSAVDLICRTAELENFRTTFESQKAMDDLVLASEVKAVLIEVKPDIQVFVRDANVILGGSALLLHEPALVNEVERIARQIPGVKSVSIRSNHLVDWTD